MKLRKLFEIATVVEPRPKDIEDILRLEGVPYDLKIPLAAKLWNLCRSWGRCREREDELERIKREVPLGGAAYVLSILTAYYPSEKQLEGLNISYKELAKVVALASSINVDNARKFLGLLPIHELLRHADGEDTVRAILELCNSYEIAEAFRRLSLVEVKRIIKKLGSITDSYMVENLLEACLDCGHNPLTLIFLVAKGCVCRGELIVAEEILYALNNICLGSTQRRRFLRALRKVVKQQKSGSTSRWGFVGGGRTTRIVLKGLEKANALPEEVVVSDTDFKTLKELSKAFPFVRPVSNNVLPANADIVFLSVPFKVMEEVLIEIKYALRPKSILVSFVPKFTAARITEILGGFDRIVRIILSPASAVNKGLNSVFFSPTLAEEEKDVIRRFLAALGKFVEVEEEKLEAYVMATTAFTGYFWIQLAELMEICKELGLKDKEAWKEACSMLKGTVELLCWDEFSVDDMKYLMDMIR